MSRRKLKSSVIMAACLAAAAIAGVVIPAHAQTFNVLYNAPGGNGVSYPAALAISQGRNGDLYTTSEQGGTIYGTLFSFTPSAAVKIVDDSGFGYFTVSGVILGTDGQLYGTDQNGGTGVCGVSNCGRVYKVSASGRMTVLHNFVGTDGQDPHAPPILGANGKYYGTAPSSTAGDGISTAYSVTSSGAFTLLHTFTTAEGQYVYGGLVQGSDGNLYGTSATGGANGVGTIFKMTTAGAVTVLHSFTGTDGNASYWPLIQASDGNYYGVTYAGGANNEGVIFKISSNGTYTVLYSLNNANGDGQSPNSSLVQGTDSKLYGVTAQGPSGVNGTIFNITTSGTFALLHTFSGTDGANPSTPLIQDTNGVFYGATSNGGTVTTCNDGCGVIYSLGVGLNPFASLGSTSGKEGAKVGIFGQGFTASSVVKFGGTQATTVTRSGTTYLTATVPAAALTGSVTVTTGATTLTSRQIFKVTPTLASFDPPSGAVGTSVTIDGTAFTQATNVTFAGQSATFTVVSDTQITATVPTGAVTGKITVTTKGGSATSKTSFTVN